MPADIQGENYEQTMAFLFIRKSLTPPGKANTILSLWVPKGNTTGLKTCWEVLPRIP